MCGGFFLKNVGWNIVFEIKVAFESMIDFILENPALPNLLLFTFVSHPVISDTLDYIV